MRKYRVEITQTGFSSLRAIGEKKIIREADELIRSLAVDPTGKGESLKEPLERFRKISLWRKKYRLNVDLCERLRVGDQVDHIQGRHLGDAKHGVDAHAEGKEYR